MSEKVSSAFTVKEDLSMPLLDRPISNNEMVVFELILAGLLGIVLLGKKNK